MALGVVTLSFHCAEFTLTAWVDVLPTVDFAVVKRIPLLRKPMQTDPSLTCWGWFHAPEFRFGAHGTLFCDIFDDHHVSIQRRVHVIPP